MLVFGTVPSSHIPDSILEMLAMQRGLPSEDFAVHEEHLLICESCRRRLAEWVNYTEALKAALVSGRAEAAGWVHQTEDGPVRCCVDEQSDGTWLAQLLGLQLAGSKSCATRAEATEYLRIAFGQMFPEHECEEGCGPPKLPE